MDFYVNYCGQGHFFHKWCAHTLIKRNETKDCPDCRFPPSNDALTLLAQSYPAAGAAAGAPAPPVPVPVPLQASALMPYRTLGGVGDKLVQWDFWIKPTEATYSRLNNQEENLKVRSTFGQYISQWWSDQGWSPVTGAGWDERLVVSVAHLVGNTLLRNTIRMTRVTCRLYVSPLVVVNFQTMFEIEMRRHGLGSMMRRWLGIIGAADPTEGSRVTANEYRTWSELQSALAARPADPGIFLASGHVDHNLWREVYTLEDDPLPITIGRPGPQSATDVPVEWCFWIKGSWALDGLRGCAREHLERWYRNRDFASDDSDVANPLNIPMRLQVEISEYYLHTVPRRAGPATVTRCDFQLYLPTTELAEEFLAAFRQAEAAALERDYWRSPSFAELMQQLVGVTGSRSTHAADFPTIRNGELRRSKRLGAYPYEPPHRPELTLEAYREWQLATLISLAPIEQSTNDAFRE